LRGVVWAMLAAGGQFEKARLPTREPAPSLGFGDLWAVLSSYFYILSIYICMCRLYGLAACSVRGAI